MRCDVAPITKTDNPPPRWFEHPLKEFVEHGETILGLCWVGVNLDFQDGLFSDMTPITQCSAVGFSECSAVMALNFGHELILQTYFMVENQRIHQHMLRQFRLVNCKRQQKIRLLPGEPFPENFLPSCKGCEAWLDLSQSIAVFIPIVKSDGIAAIQHIQRTKLELALESISINHYSMSKRQLNFRYAVLFNNEFAISFSQMKPEIIYGKRR